MSGLARRVGSQTPHPIADSLRNEQPAGAASHPRAEPHLALPDKRTRNRKAATLALLAFAMLTTSLEFLLGARAVQGLGGALVFPATLSLVNTTFAEGRERNRALAAWGGAGAAGLVVGVLLGGVLTRALGWEAAFLVNVPLAGLALLLAFALIAPDQPRDGSRRFDLPGALSATLGVTLLVVALVQGPILGWGSPAILASAAACLLLLATFALIEWRSREPLVPPRYSQTATSPPRSSSRSCSGPPSGRCCIS
jgi:MFS family permease